LRIYQKENITLYFVSFKASFILYLIFLCRAWWYIPIIPALGRLTKGISSSRPAWPTKKVPGQPGLHNETLPQKKVNKTQVGKNSFA
jgi:hypothetical protein